MSAILKILLTKLLSEKVLVAIVIKVCEYLAAKSSNKLDDVLVKELKKSFVPIVDEVLSDIQKNLGEVKPSEEKGKGALDSPGSQGGSGIDIAVGGRVNIGGVQVGFNF